MSIALERNGNTAEWAVSKWWPAVFLAGLLGYLVLSATLLAWFDVPDIALYGLFLPVAGAEIWMSYRERIRLDTSRREYVFIFAPVRLLALWALFSYLFFTQGGREGMRSHAPHLIGLLYWMLTLSPAVSLVLFFLAVCIHYGLWWRKGYGRFFTTVPFIFLIPMCSTFFWYTGGARRHSVAEITAQPGVRLVARYPSIRHASAWDDPFYHPRSVHYDPKRRMIFLTTGLIDGLLKERAATPNVWAYTLDTGAWRSLSGSGAAAFTRVRYLSVDDAADEIFVSGWTSRSETANPPVYRVRKKDMTVLETMRLSLSPSHTASTFNVLHDEHGGEIYVQWGVPPVLSAVNLASRKERMVRMDDGGRVESGALFWQAQLSADGAQLYALLFSGRGGRLAEIDVKTMRLMKMTALPQIGLSLALDEAQNEVWVGGGFTATFFVLDKHSLHLKRVIPSPNAFIRKFLLDPGGRLIYVVDQNRGAVHILSRSDGRTYDTFTLGGIIEGMVQVENELWVPGSHGIYAIRVPEALQVKG